MRALMNKETFCSSSWYFMAQQTIPVSWSISHTKQTLSEGVANVTYRNSGFHKIEWASKQQFKCSFPTECNCCIWKCLG
jgi:hypothetical protein